jgi:hypothetical protein
MELQQQPSNCHYLVQPSSDVQPTAPLCTLWPGPSPLALDMNDGAGQLQDSCGGLKSESMNSESDYERGGTIP